MYAEQGWGHYLRQWRLGDAGSYPGRDHGVAPRRRGDLTPTPASRCRSLTLAVLDRDQGRALVLGDWSATVKYLGAGVCAAVPPADLAWGEGRRRSGRPMLGASARQIQVPRQVDCGASKASPGCRDGVGMTEDMQAADTGDAVAGEVARHRAHRRRSAEGVDRRADFGSGSMPPDLAPRR